MLKIVKWVFGGVGAAILAVLAYALVATLLNPMTGSTEAVARRLARMPPDRQARLVAFTLADSDGVFRTAYDKVRLLAALRYAQEHEMTVNYDVKPIYMFVGNYFISKYGDIIYEEPGEKLAQDILMHSRRKDVIERTFALYRRNEEVMANLCDAGGDVVDPDEIYLAVYRERCPQN